MIKNSKQPKTTAIDYTCLLGTKNAYINDVVKAVAPDPCFGLWNVDHQIAQYNTSMALLIIITIVFVY